MLFVGIASTMVSIMVKQAQIIIIDDEEMEEQRSIISIQDCIVNMLDRHMKTLQGSIDCLERAIDSLQGSIDSLEEINAIHGRMVRRHKEEICRLRRRRIPRHILSGIRTTDFRLTRSKTSRASSSAMMVVRGQRTGRCQEQSS
jgi:hypothetical protein